MQFARTEAHGGDAAEITTLPQNSVPVVIVAKAVEPTEENTEALPTLVAKAVEPVKENAEDSAMAMTIISDISEELLLWTDTVITVGSPKNSEGVEESMFFSPASSPSIASTSSIAESPLYAYKSGASYKIKRRPCCDT